VNNLRLAATRANRFKQEQFIIIIIIDTITIIIVIVFLVLGAHELHSYHQNFISMQTALPCHT
jgi:hypothetical protein